MSRQLEHRARHRAQRSAFCAASVRQLRRFIADRSMSMTNASTPLPDAVDHPDASTLSYTRAVTHWVSIQWSRVLIGIFSAAFALSAAVIAFKLLAEPALTTANAGAINRQLQSTHSELAVQHQIARPAASDVSASERSTGSGVRIVIHLVKCSESLLICDEISTEHLRFADMTECATELPKLIQFAQSHLQRQVVMGRCHYLVAKPRTLDSRS